MLILTLIIWTSEVLQWGFLVATETYHDSPLSPVTEGQWGVSRRQLPRQRSLRFFMYRSRCWQCRVCVSLILNIYPSVFVVFRLSSCLMSPRASQPDETVHCNMCVTSVSMTACPQTCGGSQLDFWVWRRPSFSVEASWRQWDSSGRRV